MINGIIKTAALTPEIRVGDVKGNLKNAVSLAKEAAALGVKIAVFPELSLTGATAGDLFFTSTIHKSAEVAVSDFADATEELDTLFFVGAPVSLSGRIYNATVAIYGGDILGIIPKTALSPDERRYFSQSEGVTEVVFGGRETIFGSEILIGCEGVDGLLIAAAIGSEIKAPLSTARFAAAAGATLIVNPDSSPELVSRAENEDVFLRSESRTLACAVIRAEAGVGESGTDGVFGGRSGVYSLGRRLANAEPYKSGITLADIDTELIAFKRNRLQGFEGDLSDYEIVSFAPEISETPLSEKPNKYPFIPENEAVRDSRMAEIYEMQATALAKRIERSYSKGVVVGVSGGLDSTLALLVAARSMDILGMPRSNITSVTMPCFGTTKRTKSNAEKLAETLKTELRVVDIKAAVTQHFKDIGHDTEDFSVVYENAQARERTQVLMDIANATGALVVGTGDLSELALGWATYNGDHMSMYGVNAGIPKTLMRYMVGYIAKNAEENGEKELSAVLLGVLDTPVSPELLPPKDGEIAQCTEGIVGPYELHDFFLYNLVACGYSAEKILRLATLAFEGEYDAETVKGWLRVFMRRFFSQQFKRSCLPDGPKIGGVGFSPRGDFKLPSDAVGKLWEIE